MNSSYVLTRPNNFLNVSKIVTIHYNEFDRSFEFFGEEHDFWEIVYVDSGSVEIKRDNEKVFLNQGEILFHQPNEFHTIKSNDSCPNFFVISFVCRSPAMATFKRHKSALKKNLRSFITSIITEAENTYYIPKNDTSLKKLVLRDTAPIGGEQLIKTYLEQFLIIMAREISKNDDVSVFPSKESLETQLISDIKMYIESKIKDKLSIDDICNHFGYSKTYLCHIYKSQCSVSLIKYYNMRKIVYAKKLIREKKYNLSQISEELSFDNPQYFSRVFKRVTNMTPTEFMNSLEIDR